MSESYPMFETDEILWFDNGKWGKAGYAIPNPSGKTWTNNSVIFQIHQLVGRNLFELLHRPDVKFYNAPHKQFWYDLHQLITTARKRIADRTRAPNDSNGLVVMHATPAPQTFLVYPVPYFGERIRQPDVREYAQIALLMLSEIMQHSDNEHATHITPSFAGTIGKFVQEILALMSTKYFGKTREEVYAPDFALADIDFANYDPSKVMTSVEMSEERPPLQWWPTENDQSQIRGKPITDALVFAKRWPGNALPTEESGNVTVGTGGRPVSGPTSSQLPASSFVLAPGSAP